MASPAWQTACCESESREGIELELEDVIVNGKSSWTIGERYHGHVPCNVDKVAYWLQEHYEDFLKEELK